jgi:hypothetical protein
MINRSLVGDIAGVPEPDEVFLSDAQRFRNERVQPWIDARQGHDRQRLAKVVGMHARLGVARHGAVICFFDGFKQTHEVGLSVLRQPPPSGRAWVSATRFQFFTFRCPVQLVEFQKTRSDLADRGPPLDSYAAQLKVFRPRVRPRIEEPHQFARVRVSRGNVRSFVPIAAEAGKCEILSHGLPFMFFTNDVIDFTPEIGVIFVD